LYKQLTSHACSLWRIPKRIFSIIFIGISISLVGLFLAACSPSAPTQSMPTSATTKANPLPTVQLKVYAPSALTEASKELGAAFENRNPGVKIGFEIGHSPTHRLQLEQGARADVFISAGEKDMKDAIATKLVAEGASAVFAHNQLIVVLPPNNPAKIQSLEDLARPGVKVLLAAEEVPAGKVTRDLLEKLDKARSGQELKAKILTNVTSNEPGVKPIIAKLKLAEADAGIVYISDSVAAPDLKTVIISPEVNVVAKFTIAPLLKSDAPDQAKAFTVFALSSEGQAILKKMGFQPPTP